MQETVQIEKLVHGGQGLATLADGRKVFVWNALPGETVRIRLIKAKKSYAEAIAEEVLVVSPERLQPSESNYLATSPWQIMTFDAENSYKRSIVSELFNHEAVGLPPFGDAIHDNHQWHYRSKMEYSFWGDDDGLHLALHQRGSHGKQIVTGSKLALPAVDAGANGVLAELRRGGQVIRAGDLKTVIVRCNQVGQAVGALFVRRRDLPKLSLPPELAGLRVYYSNPRSPASVSTELLYELGDCILHDSLLNKDFVYDVNSFFQVNLPVFETSLHTIKENLARYAPDAMSVIDMYAGVGTIGLSAASQSADLIELDPASVRMAAHNAEQNLASGGPSATVIEASTEKVLDYIVPDKPVIFDPPRAGLHDKVTARVLDVLPPLIIYLSCNPATHARDLARLQTAYQIVDFGVYNFFPRTPHIETLAILRLV